MKIVAVVLLVAVSMAAGAAIYPHFVPPPEPVVEADSPTLTEAEATAVVKTRLAKRTAPGGQFDCLAYWTYGANINHWNADYRGDGVWVVTAAAAEVPWDWAMWLLYQNTLSIDKFKTKTTLPYC